MRGETQCRFRRPDGSRSSIVAARRGARTRCVESRLQVLDVVRKLETEFIALKIEVLGLGCSKCRATVGVIERAAHAAGVEVDIVKVEDRAAIERAGSSHLSRTAPLEAPTRTMPGDSGANTLRRGAELPRRGKQARRGTSPGCRQETQRYTDSRAAARRKRWSSDRAWRHRGSRRVLYRALPRRPGGATKAARYGAVRSSCRAMLPQTRSHSW